MGVPLVSSVDGRRGRGAVGVGPAASGRERWVQRVCQSGAGWARAVASGVAWPLGVVAGWWRPGMGGVGPALLSVGNAGRGGDATGVGGRRMGGRAERRADNEGQAWRVGGARACGALWAAALGWVTVMAWPARGQAEAVAEPVDGGAGAAERVAADGRVAVEGLAGVGGLGGGVPDPAWAARAFGLVEGWVRGWASEPGEALGEAAGDGAEMGEGAGAWVSACVMLRVEREGVVSVVGLGVASGSDGERAVLWRAARAAMTEAEGTLPGAFDVLRDREAELAELRSGARVSVEVSGAWREVGEDDFDALSKVVVPGVDGLGWVRSGAGADGEGGDGGSGAAMPLAVLMRGRPDVLLAARGLVGEMSGEVSLALEPLGVVRERGWGLWRFRTLQMVQGEAGGAGRFVHRGSEVREEGGRAPREVAALADRIAGYLASRRWPGQEHYGLRGTLDPFSGRSEPEVASGFEQMLGAYALLRYARSPWVSGEGSRRAADVAVRLLVDLIVVEAGEVAEDGPEPWEDVSTAAMGLVALSELRREVVAGDEFLGGLWTRCLETVLGRVSPSGSMTGVPAGSEGLVALALVRLARLQLTVESRELAEAAVGWVYSSAGPRLATRWPWVVWAELELREFKNERGPLARAGALRLVRGALWERQVGRVSAGYEDRDVVGGLALGPGGGTRPTWQSLPYVAALARMAGEEALTGREAGAGGEPAEATVELVRLGSAVRFVDQLTAGGVDGWLHARAGASEGGVRVSPWQHGMPVSASAYGLLVLVETLGAVESIGASMEAGAEEKR